jgi:hypothetical protein
MSGTQPLAWRRMRYSFFVWSIFLGALTSSASAQTFTGTVTNATTQKPAVGDEVVLLDFSDGLREVAHTRCDSTGGFSFHLDDPKRQWILRVIHQGTSYFKVAVPGTSSIHVEVYDVSTKLKGIVVTADVTRFQVKGDFLQAARLFAVKNNSAPPQTQMSDRNFEFYLPEGAKIDYCTARSATGQPIRTLPLPQNEKNLYAFIFPLRPGETQLQVLFHMPYKGAVTINPKPAYAVDHFVVMLPKKMHFTPSLGTAFQAMSDPTQSDVILQVASNTTVGQPLTFTLSGTGVLAETKAENVGSVKSANALKIGRTVRAAPASTAAVPPAPATDPSGKVQWYILGGFGVLLAAAGTMSIARRSTKRRVPHYVRPKIQNDVVVSRAKSGLVNGRKSILNDLKEQRFQLEIEHEQKRISQPEYEKAMAAFHQNLEQAMRRNVAAVN